MWSAIEWLGGFYAFIGGWVALSYLGHRIASWREGHHA